MLERAIRAFNPAPGAWCEIGSERIKILYARVDPGSLPAGITGAGLAIGTGKGVLQPLLVQRPGKPAMAARDLLNGWPIPPGTQVNPP